MFALISANLVNAFGNWVLIYGHLGFSPRVLRVGLVDLLLAHLSRLRARNHLFVVDPSGGCRQGSARASTSEGVRLLNLGGPRPANLAGNWGFCRATAICARLGPVPLSGHEIALNCAALSFMVPLGISSAAAVRLDNKWEGQSAAARHAGWSAMAIGVGFMAASGLVFVTFSRAIARLFPMIRRWFRWGPTVAGRGRVPIVRCMQIVATALSRYRRHANADAGPLVAYWFLAFRSAIPLLPAALGVVVSGPDSALD